MQARFILSKKKLIEQVKKLEDLGLKVSYSYKTNKEVGKLLQDCSKVDFSIHAFEEVNDIRSKERVWFFTQAEDEQELAKLLNLGIKNFVVDNRVDLERLLQVLAEKKVNIDLSLRMKFKEHRIGSGKYFVYGMSSKEINKLVSRLKENQFIGNLGVHIHRKSQNTSEWNIVEELKDSLNEDSLSNIAFINLGGGLPSIYRSSSVNVFSYIFSKISEAVKWLKEREIEVYIEPGRFLAAPCIKLVAEIIQKYDKNLVINTTIYNCALDNVLTGTKMLVEGELEGSGQDLAEDNEDYLIKGNSPTRDDIFRYKVKLSVKKVGDKLVFLNAGAYNYTTDFFGYTKLETKVVDDF